MSFLETKRVLTVHSVSFEYVFTCNLHAVLQNACVFRVPAPLGFSRFPPASPHLLDNFLYAGAVKCDTDPQKDMFVEQKKATVSIKHVGFV